jgi:hypothetical protein
MYVFNNVVSYYLGKPMCYHKLYKKQNKFCFNKYFSTFAMSTKLVDII